MMAGQWRYAEGDWEFDSETLLIRTIQRFFSYFSNLVSENLLTYHCELFNGVSDTSIQRCQGRKILHLFGRSLPTPRF